MKLNRVTQRTVEILKLASENPDGTTLGEICDKLQPPKTGDYDIVAAPAETGMMNVARGQKQRYTIGLTTYHIGTSCTNNLDSIGVIEPKPKALAREMGKTVFFGVRSNHEVVYICKVEPENPIITTATAGTKNLIYYTSLSKAILASNGEETKQQVMNRIRYRKKTEQTILSGEALKQELEKVRAKGYALDVREAEDHMECADTPVFGPDGSVPGAVNVSSPYKPTEDYEVLGTLVREKAAQVSKILGYLPPKTSTNPAG